MTPFASLIGADERDHHPDVGQPHVVADVAQRLALHGEAVGEVLGEVPRRPAVADHRVLLVAARSSGPATRLAYSLDLKSDIRTMTGYGANAAASIATPSATRWTKNSRGPGVRRDGLLDLGAEVGGQLVRSDSSWSSACGWMPICRLMTNSRRARPTPAVRQLGERERLLGRADVHHDLDRDVRHRVQLGALDREVEQPLVDQPGVALGARDRHLAAVGQVPGGAAGADHGGDAELAGDDRGVAGPAAAVGHDRGGPLHDRLPVGVGHVGDEHLAGLEVAHLVGALSTRTAPAPIFWPIARPSTSTSAPAADSLGIL